MLKTSNAVIAATLAASFALAGGVAIVAGANPSPAAPPEPGLGRDAAVARVRMLVPDAVDLHASDVQGSGVNKFYPVDGKGIHANVDAETGRVRTLFVADRAPTVATVAVSPGQALAVAKAYLRDHAISEVGNAPEVTLVDRGDTQEYVITWRTRVNGAWAPDTRSVSVNPATGEVFALQNQSRPYSPPPTAKIAQAEAVKAAAAALGWDQPIVRDAELYVSFDDQGSQQLVWLVRLVGVGGSSASVFVDAMTGTAVVDSRS
jgi:hypothetical protein